MINILGETREELQQTIDFIHTLPATKISTSIAVPMYDIKWYNIAVEQRVLPRHIDEEYWDPYNMKTLDKDRPIFKTEMSREELIQLYSEIQKYSKKLFYFDWKNRKE